MGLRIKILSGFIVLAIMLSVAGFWSIYEFNSIGSSVQRILDENYKSIQFSKSMVEALEREDSGVLILLSGNWDEGRAIINKADSLFLTNFEAANNNITIEGEKSHLEEIQDRYRHYKNLWEKPVVGTVKEGNVKWYFDVVHQSFLSVKKSVENLIDLNDKTMYRTASELKDKSGRAIMPGIIAVLSALVFTFIFNYLVNYFMVNPIIQITNRINLFKEKRRPFDVQVESHDELADLAASIQVLCYSISDQENKE
ncbi:MAG: hypothetical protein E4H13_05980 [Calditrichales bacterium]|nr:MAG: hypothetical protein E4H13_05980 [Calditrichales bacterium]